MFIRQVLKRAGVGTVVAPSTAPSAGLLGQYWGTACRTRPVRTFALRFSSSTPSANYKRLFLVGGAASVGFLTATIAYAGHSTAADSPPDRTKFERIPSRKALEPGESQFEVGDRFVTILAGNGNPELAKMIADKLGTKLSPVSVGTYADGETSVKIEESVREKDVYIIQPTGRPSNNNLMELIFMISACRRASAKRIIAVIPYFGYKLEIGGESVIRKQSIDSSAAIAAADVSKMLEVMGVDHVITVDLQPPGQGQVEGFFANTVNLDSVEATFAGVEYLRPIIAKDAVVVSASPTCTKKARDFQSGLMGPAGYRWFDGEMQKMNVRIALFIPEVVNANGTAVPQVPYPHSLPEKDSLSLRRKLDKTFRLDLVGDVRGKDCVIVDDMVDTGSALLLRADALKSQGARKVYAFATHGVFSEDAVERIRSSESLEQVIVTDTLPWVHPEEYLGSKENGHSEQIVRVSISGLVAECIRRVHDRESLKQYTAYQPNISEEARMEGQLRE